MNLINRNGINGVQQQAVISDGEDEYFNEYNFHAELFIFLLNKYKLEIKK